MDTLRSPDRATAATTPSHVRRQENGSGTAAQDDAQPPQWRWWADPAERTHRHAQHTTTSSATKSQKISPCSVVMAAGRLLSAKIGSGKARSRVLHSDLAPGGEEQQQQHRLFFSDSGEEEEDEEGHESDDSDLEDEFSSDSLSEWEDDGVDDEEDDVDDDDDAEEEEEEEAQQEKREGAHAPRAIIDRQDSHAQDNQWGRGWTHRFPNEPRCERSTSFPSDARGQEATDVEQRVPHFTYPTQGGGEISVRYVKSIPKPLDGLDFVLQCVL